MPSRCHAETRDLGATFVARTIPHALLFLPPGGTAAVRRSERRRSEKRGSKAALGLKSAGRWLRRTRRMRRARTRWTPWAWMSGLPRAKIFGAPFCRNTPALREGGREGGRGRDRKRNRGGGEEGKEAWHTRVTSLQRGSSSSFPIPLIFFSSLLLSSLELSDTQSLRALI